MSYLFSKRLSFFVISILIISIFSVYCSDTYGEGPALQAYDAGETGMSAYAAYDALYRNIGRPGSQVVIDASRTFTDDGANVQISPSFKGKENVLVWNSQSGSINWTFHNNLEGRYILAIEYYPIPGKGGDIEFSLAINGKVPFSEAARFAFPRIWKDVLNSNGEFDYDGQGNQILPKQSEAPEWRLSDFRDSEGMYNEPFSFYIPQGENTLRLTCIRETVAVKSIRLYNKSEELSYKAPAFSEQKQDGLPEITIIQAEKPSHKSQSRIHANYDRSNPATLPYDPVKIRLNTIGGDAWKYPGQWIQWEFNVEKAGYYKIGARFRQNLVRGLFTMRRVYINGSLPFHELSMQRFPFSLKWQTKNFGNENEDFIIYLKEGVNTITMEPTLGDMDEALRSLDECQLRLNEMYRKIIMLTSVQPDIFTDYSLDTEIPELLPTFGAVAEALDNESSRFEKLTGYSGSEAVLLKRMSEQLKSFIKDPYSIPERLSKYRDNLSGLSAWIMRIREQPLELDYLYLIPAEKTKPPADKGFLAQVIHEIRAFVGTFFEDYNRFGDDKAIESKKSPALEVWVGGGRDQAQVISRLVDNLFTPSTGIRVQVKLVSGALVQSVMAGKGPDVALNVGRGDPINLASRGAVEPLDGYGSFNSVSSRFQNGALIPYEMGGKTYALPEQQAFHMMFYRKDIFKELGLKPPDTWDEFYEAARILQRNNLQAGLPYLQVDAFNLIGVGMGAINLFPALLLQNGGTVYNDNHTRTALDTPMAYEAFAEWVNFYTQYSFPLFKDDYYRFRTGEMPLTISFYTFYNQLLAAAPELRNLWAMAPIPGKRQTDGSINRAESATGTAAIMLSSSDKKEDAWRFMDWWTSREAQTGYGLDMEALSGPMARYSTANVEAFEQLPWSKAEAELIESQWRYVVEIPEVPGGYYVSRNLDNAFKAAVYRRENVREMLNYWNLQSNNEIERKRKEMKIPGDEVKR